LSINGLGLGLPWTIKNIYKKYDEERRVWKELSNMIWKEDKRKLSEFGYIFLMKE
jgi:hypothetical protein